MNIVKYPVKTYREHCMCECGGEYILNTNEFLTNVFLATGYSHICNKCGKEIKLEKTYPDIVQYEVKNTEENS